MANIHHLNYHSEATTNIIYNPENDHDTHRHNAPVLEYSGSAEPPLPPGGAMLISRKFCNTF